jgi:hypothetical protein
MQELERGDSGLRSFVSVQGRARDVSDSDIRIEEQRVTGCRAWLVEKRSVVLA